VERPAPPSRPRSPLIPLFLAAVAGAVMASLVWAAGSLPRLTLDQPCHADVLLELANR
jgi:hypothetical protein